MKKLLKDIVEETGMSRGWIYLYFTDKIEIFEALLLHLDDQLDGAFSPQKLEQMTLISILREFLESYKLIFTTIDEVFTLRFMNFGFRVGENQERKRFSHIVTIKLLRCYLIYFKQVLKKKGLSLHYLLRIWSKL